MEQMGQGVATKDADVVPGTGAVHRMTNKVDGVAEELYPAVAHAGTYQDRLCGVGVEVGEAASAFDAASEGVEVAAVVGDPLGVVHEEDMVERLRGGVGGRDTPTGLVPPDLLVDAVLHARHGATLPRAGTQEGGGGRLAVRSPHVHLQRAVMALQGRGVGSGNPGSHQRGQLGVVVD